MGKKNIIAKFFIALASFLLLAHAVYPHTHHDDIVCFIENHIDHCCSHDHSDDNDAQQTGCHHQHGENEDCVLKKILLQEKAFHNTIVYIPQPDFIQCIYPDILDISEIISPNSFFLESPDIESFYTSYISPVKGLRAPPHC